MSEGRAKVSKPIGQESFRLKQNKGKLKKWRSGNTLLNQLLLRA
jgi:hypothetical protein